MNEPHVFGMTTKDMDFGTPERIRADADLRAHPEQQYLSALRKLVAKHEADPMPREDRTGTGTFSTFGAQWRFDLSKGFPLLTTKKLFTKGIIAELLWMISGSTNIAPLAKQRVHIWDEWADDKGELGPVYGKQWRSWPGVSSIGERKPIDQLMSIIHQIQMRPNDRGHVVSAWNVADLPKMGLRPCHCLFQFYVEDGKLSCQLYQRSADIFLGVPFNIASYALLTELVARECGLEPGEFIHTFGDLHLYANHVEQAKLQLERDPRPLPQLLLPPLEDDTHILRILPEHITIDGYDPHPEIKGDVSI